MITYRDFKKGVRVEAIKAVDGLDLIGYRGTIVSAPENSNDNVGVQFDRTFSGGHSCGGRGKEGHCRFGYMSCFRLIKKERAQKVTTIKISEKIHNRFSNILDNVHKYNRGITCFMMGMNNKNVIDTLVSLHKERGGGCENMPRYSAEVLSQAMIKLAIKDRMAIGLARFGDGRWSSRSADEGSANYALNELLRGGEYAAIILSISQRNRADILIESLTKRGRYNNRFVYSVVK
jgi:hypothetical protein